MKSTSVIRAMCLFTAGIMTSGSLLAVPRNNGAPAEASVEWQGLLFHMEASQLLRQVQWNAADLAREAAVLESFANGRITRVTHSFHANLVRGHINTIGKQLSRLQEIRHVSAPWQREAIDAVVPIAANVATETEAAIRHLNDSSKPLWLADYTDRLHAIYDHSDRVKDAIDLHLEMAETGQKLEQLREGAKTLGS
jgi:hypothetical protein